MKVTGAKMNVPCFSAFMVTVLVNSSGDPAGRGEAVSGAVVSIRENPSGKESGISGKVLKLPLPVMEAVSCSVEPAGRVCLSALTEAE